MTSNATGPLLLGVSGFTPSESWREETLAGTTTRVGRKRLNVAHGDFGAGALSPEVRTSVLLASATRRTPRSSTDIVIEHSEITIVADGQPCRLDCINVNGWFDASGSIGGSELSVTGRNWRLAGMELVRVPEESLADQDALEDERDDEREHDFQTHVARSTARMDRWFRRVEHTFFSIDPDKPARIDGYSWSGKTAAVRVTVGRESPAPLVVSTITPASETRSSFLQLVNGAIQRSGLPVTLHVQHERRIVTVNAIKVESEIFCIEDHALLLGTFEGIGFAVNSRYSDLPHALVTLPVDQTRAWFEKIRRHRSSPERIAAMQQRPAEP